MTMAPRPARRGTASTRRGRTINAAAWWLLPASLAILGACASQRSHLSHQIGDDIVFETGAEPQAEIVADSLPAAMRQVETAHRHAFKAQPVILVFATNEKFERTTGYHAERVAGVSTPGGLYLAPQNPGRLEQVLLHELSHVLLRQWIGSYAFHRTPIWFREGLATWAAGGGGAGSVTRAQAAAALLSGNAFQPNLIESSLFRKDASHWGLSHHMFYRQSSMFIDYLAAAQTPAWRRLLEQVHKGARFETAYASSFDSSVATLWRAFMLTLT